MSARKTATQHTNAAEIGRRQTLGILAGAALGSLSQTWSLGGTAAASQQARNPIKIGQIGTKHAHASKLSVYRNNPDYEVVGIVEADPQRRSGAMQQTVYQGLPWMSHEELLATPGLQAVLVETDVPDLLDAAEACIAAGKHIHLDKPAGASWPQFQRILKEAERQQLLIQMGYMYRYNPGIVLLREFLDNGWLGDVFEVHAVMSKVVGPGERKSLARYSGGMMFELGCHLIDLVVGILGQPTDIQSYLQHVGPENDDLNDSTLAVFQYPRATATIRTSGVEVAGGERRHLTVCGTLGTFHMQPLDNPQVRVAFDRPRGTYGKGYQDVKLPRYARYVDDAADMARVIRGEAVNRFPYSHDAAVQESVLRACQMPL